MSMPGVRQRMRKLVYTDMASRLRDWLKEPANSQAFADTWNAAAAVQRAATKNCACEACHPAPVSEGT